MIEKRKTVLVTGGSGTLGWRLCQSLAQSNYNVVTLDKRNPPEQTDSIQFSQGDLDNFEAISSKFEDVDVVVHTAALHGYHLPHYRSDTFFTNNVLGLFHVLTACQRHGVKRLVFTSSTSIYGTSADPVNGKAQWIDEDTPPGWRTSDIYDASKIIGENLCEHAAQELNLEIIALRTARFFYDDYVSYNVRKLFRGIDVRDVVQAHALAIEAPVSKGYLVCNIAAKSPFNRNDVENLYTEAPSVIERYFPGVRELFNRNNWCLPARIDRVYDISRAERELNFCPKHNFGDFLNEVYYEQSALEVSQFTQVHVQKEKYE